MAEKNTVESSIKIIEQQHPGLMNSDIDSVFKKQSKYALQLRTSSLAERKSVLKKFLTTLEKYTLEIIEAGNKDFSKPETEILISEILPVVHEIKHSLRHIATWMKPKSVSATRLTLGSKSKVIYEPKGVCLIISPWNYPVNLTFVPLVSALAAGNTAMIKTSELSPFLSAVMTKIIKEAFDERHVAIFEGEVEVSLKLLEKPFDHIFFTGSPQVGKSVMAAAAKNLTSVTLELGGKSPVIIDQTIDIKKTAGKISWGKFMNNGQTCISPDYVLVHESVVDAFVDEMKSAIQTSFGPNIRASVDRSRVVNVRHTKRIKGLIDDAIQNGGQVAFGGEVDVEDRYIDPTLIVGGKIDETKNNAFINSRLMQDEIFGPVLPIVSYNSLDEAVSYINSRPKPLALYIYSDKNHTINYVLDRTSSGATCINNSMVHGLHGNLPFGGVNDSGLGGTSHGEYGFKTFSHERAVMEDKCMSIHLFYPPYTPLVQLLVKVLTKYWN